MNIEILQYIVQEGCSTTVAYYNKYKQEILELLVEEKPVDKTVSMFIYDEFVKLGYTTKEPEIDKYLLLGCESKKEYKSFIQKILKVVLKLVESRNKVAYTLHEAHGKYPIDFYIAFVDKLLNKIHVSDEAYDEYTIYKDGKKVYHL